MRRVRIRAFLFTAIFLSTGSAASAQTAPTVTHVRASQRSDASKLVDVYYDLAHNAPCTVWVVFSGDGGVSWNVPAMTMTGHLGPTVAPGPNRRVIWDAAADIPGVMGSYRARVYADDGSGSSDMVLVPAGSFPYQRDFAHQVFVGSFFIDKYEVTNQRYAEFLNDGNGQYHNTNMEITASGDPSDRYYAVYPGRQNYPIRFVNTIDAEAYAEWLSEREGKNYRLPTEQEWEKAAGWDPTLNKHWAFGYQDDALTCSSANLYVGSSPCVGAPTEVGHYNGLGGTDDAHSYFGCYDMTGNVWEWTSSDLGAGIRAIRGNAYGGGGAGNCANNASGCTVQTRASYPSVNRVDNVGFRLVLEPH